ncbi:MULTISPECIES: hypothetical protein [Streptomyces]|uniref:Uncharacterized protein n=1 Tax=Streptomyces venezuelae (strain ATCC 10712 / CBS 650.69 / DSM 40230 / JCM 4526 / NBRC 13096 / PD 04745) TaxID=953739 RepID=F2RGB9_STRVP|nr:hypothetical protein [Streptomyces venezuelae]APE25257.1 hypothetical protein vnz_32325 [Streptomyces venezuelae]QES02598.1 hypothetical protein DEJ43_32855 [Streptomyces venezuelae ATCC 10712]CCA59839.1 hypothetical protein SVEN_6553 [Streptomyces venezuelae ATCC 10712]
MAVAIPRGEGVVAEVTAAPAADVLADEPVAPVVLPAPRPAAIVPSPEPEPAGIDDDQELVLEELTREQVLDWRNRAAADHQLVFDRIDRYGEPSAQRLFTGRSSPRGSTWPAWVTWTSVSPPGGGMSGGEMSRVDLARVAIRAAKEASRKNRARVRGLPPRAHRAPGGRRESRM